MNLKGLCLLLVLIVFLPFGSRAQETTASEEIDGTIEKTVSGIQSRLVELPEIIVSRHEGIFREPGTDLVLEGEMLIVSGSWTALPHRMDPVYMIVTTLSEAHWSEVIQYSADGPDGTFQVLSKENLFIYLRGNWDGGDDADSLYTPSDTFQIIVVCGEMVNN